MIFTKEDRYTFNKSKVCHICEKKFDNPKDPPVRDHCHFTGKFRGAAHGSCNLACRKPKFIPVIFQSFRL